MTSLSESVDAFVSEYLPDSPAECKKSKFFHDPLWGTVELYPHELCIVDTPLFQRLRQIHQTGNVFATFPSAKHTRFEHSIGVLHIASMIAGKLIDKYPGIVGAESRMRVRLAGLCHDLGHGAFSHTSEEFYSKADDLAPLLASGGDFQGKGGGEVLSYLIITSPSFRKYFDIIKAKYNLKIEIDHFAPLVLGRKIDQESQFEADIISGPFDADKLDYFPRDGHSAGIDMAIDIGRLLHTMGIGKVKSKIGGEETYSLIVSMGGYNSIQQLLFARATLFSTMYHHHKVRACDCMVKACYEHFIAQKNEFRSRSKRRGLTLKSAADYLYFTDLDFFAEALQHDEESHEHKLVHDLLYRRLLKRVLIISTNTVKYLSRSPAGVEEKNIKQQRAAYSNFINMRERADILRAHAIRISEKAKLTADNCQIWFDIPQPPSFGKAGGAKLNIASRGSGECDARPLSEFIPVEEWIRTYEQYHSKSYLFGPDDRDKRIDLAIAAIKYLSEVLALHLTKDAMPDDIRNSIIERMPAGSFD